MTAPVFGYRKSGDGWSVVWRGRVIGHLAYDRIKGWTSDYVPVTTGKPHRTRQQAAEVLLRAFQNEQRRRA